MLKNKEAWQQNLIVLWFGTFMAGMAFSEIMPFLSLYVDTLGHFSRSQLTFLSGITFSATFVVTAIVSPLWGKLADRKGRKLMLLRASLGMAVVLGAMGLVSNVWQLIGLRLLQGVFSGYISNANALIASETPKAQAGKAMGTIVTGSTAGGLLGPLLGGTLAGIFSYRMTFFITAGILMLVFFLSWFFVKETFQPSPEQMAHAQTSKQVWGQIKYPHLIWGLFITTMIIQAGNNSITPILSLYVRELLHGHGSVTIMAGIVAAVPGIATIVAAPRFGRLGDRIGTDRMITFGFIFAIIVYIATAFTTNIWQLIALRFLVGISDATMVPAVQTMLTKYTPRSATSRIFSYNQSFQAMGNIMGPQIGSVVSHFFNYTGVFVSTAVLVGMNFTLFRFNSKPVRKERELREAAEHAA